MNQLNVAFYTEAGKKRGLGHLVRSYAIYEKFKSLNIKASFFLDSDIKFQNRFNGVTYFKWNDFKVINKCDLIFIDSYEADINIYKKVSESCALAVYIDDYGRLNYPKGCILNFAPNAEETFFKQKKTKHSYLLGLDYLPIRELFLKMIPTEQKQIFIMLGGSDTANLSSIITDLLEDINVKKVIVVNNKQVAEMLSEKVNVEVLYQPSDAELIKTMAKSSLAVSTASMSLYELSYLKVPTIAIAVAENQEVGAKQLVKHRLAKSFVSIADKHWQNVLKEAVRKLYLTERGAIMDRVVDGAGTQRIFNETQRLITK